MCVELKYGIWKCAQPQAQDVNELVRGGFTPLTAMVLAGRIQSQLAAQNPGLQNGAQQCCCGIETQQPQSPGRVPGEETDQAPGQQYRACAKHRQGIYQSHKGGDQKGMGDPQQREPGGQHEQTDAK